MQIKKVLSVDSYISSVKVEIAKCYLVGDGKDLVVYYFDPLKRLLTKECIGPLQGKDVLDQTARTHQLFKHFQEEVQASVNFLAKYRIEFNTDNFMRARHTYEVLSFDLSRDVQLKIFVEHKEVCFRVMREEAPLYDEKFASLGNGRALSNICCDILDLFQENVPISEWITNREHSKRLQSINYYVKSINLVEAFRSVLEQRPSQKIEHLTSIYDKDFTFFDLIAPYFTSDRIEKLVYPYDLALSYVKLLDHRNFILRNLDQFPELEEYYLYRNEDLVACKIAGEISVGAYPHVPTVHELLHTVITEAHIVKHVNMRKWLGETVGSAISKQKSVQWMIELRSFDHNERDKWSKSDQFAYAYILRYIQAQGKSVTGAQETQYDIFKLTDPFHYNVYDYLNSKITCLELDLKAENATSALTAVKLFEYALKYINLAGNRKHQFDRPNHSLKNRILELSPHLLSHEVFTQTLQTRDLKFCMRHLDPLRAIKHSEIRHEIFSWAKELSTSLSEIIGYRGNSGSGKSTHSQGNALNVDRVKATLKDGIVLNKQIHCEAAHLFQRVLNKVGKKHLYTLDARLLTVKDLNEDILELAKERPVKIIDLDVPLLTSLLRVLVRPTFGKEPCPTLNVVVDGFVKIRKEREAIINRLHENATYLLHFEGELIAEKRNGKLTIHNDRLYNLTLTEPDKGEIQATLSRVLDQELVNKAVENHIIYDSQIKNLVPYIGLSLGDAVEQHAYGTTKKPE